MNIAKMQVDSTNNKLAMRNDLKLSQFNYICEYSHLNLVWMINQLDVNSSVSKNSPIYPGYTALHFAVKSGNLEAVKLLLEIGADFTIKNARGQTPLHLATMLSFSNNSYQKYGLSIIDNILMAQKSNYANPVDNMGLSHFHIASLRDKHSIVQGFLLNGVDVNTQISFKHLFWPGYTSLHISTKYSSSCTTDLLLKFGANIEIKNASGHSPLYFAIHMNNGLLIKTLFSALKKNCINPMDNDGLSILHAYSVYNYGLQGLGRLLQNDININLSIKSNSLLWPGYTPLHVAIHSKCFSSAMVLLTHGADINAVDSNGITPLQLAIRKHLVNNNFMDIVWYEFNKIYLEPITGKKLFELYGACMSGDLDLIQYLLNGGLNVNSPVPLEYPLHLPGYTPLHFAIEYGSIKAVDLLLNNGAGICIQDSNGFSPLHLAVHRKNFDIVKRIMSSYSQITKNPIDNTGLSHLHIACMGNYTTIVEKFLQMGEQVNLVTKSGQTLLHYAVEFNSEHTVLLLLKNNADITLQNLFGKTALHLAVENMNNKISDLILLYCNKGFTTNPVDKTGFSHFHIMCMENKTNLIENLIYNGVSVNTPVNINAPKYAGFTPLHFAVKYNCIETIQLLLNNGAEIDIKNAVSKVPLHYIIRLKSNKLKILDLFWNVIINSDDSRTTLTESTGLSHLCFSCLMNDDQSVKNILQSNSRINHSISLSLPIWPGYSPLHFAVKYGSVKIVELLLSYHAEIEITDKYGLTPLHLACCSSNLDIVKFLLANGADPAARSIKNLTPLRLAIQGKNKEISKLLLSHIKSMHKNPMDNKGFTYFHIVCLMNMNDLARDYIKNGIDLNEQVHPFAHKYAGYTPLHIAVQHKNLKLFDILLSHGAKVNIKDKHIQTPLYLTSDIDVVLKLLEKKLDLEARDARGDTLIEMAIRYEKPRILEAVLQYGANPNIPHIFEKRYPLERAMVLKKDKIVEILLRAGADYQLVNREYTIVHAAVINIKGTYNFYVRLFKRFINLGYSLNALDDSSHTPLHCSYYPYNLPALEALLQCGADVNVEDRSGRSIISYFMEIKTSRMPGLQFYKIFLRHLMVKIIAGFEISCTNELLYGTLVEIWDDFFGKEDYDNFVSTVENNITLELKRMEDMNFGGYTTLKEMIKNVHKMAVHLSRNNGLANLVSCCGFKEIFPECGCLIMMQYAKALKRRDLIQPAVDAVNKIIRETFKKIPWNLQCSELVVEYLDDKDLKNLSAI